AGNESAASAEVTATRSSDTSAPANPSNLMATGSQSGISLDWADNTEGDLAGYNIYRSTARGKPWMLLNASRRLTSAYYANGASPYLTANATRPADTTKPAQPSGLVLTAAPSGITLDWADNTDSDLAGYNVYRSPDGVNNWMLLNTSGLLTSSIYTDGGAPVG